MFPRLFDRTAKVILNLQQALAYPNNANEKIDTKQKKTVREGEGRTGKRERSKRKSAGRVREKGMGGKDKSR